MAGHDIKPPPSLVRKLLVGKLREPIYFTGLIDEWDILSWDLQKWSSSLGDKLMPFRSGIKRSTPAPQWERTCQMTNMTMRDFIELIHKHEADSKCSTNWFYFDYKYMHEWFQDHPDILSSVNWESFGFPEVKGDQSTIWIGSDGAHTPCHFDTYGCNLVAQIYGMKQWILFPPESSCSLLPTRVPYEESSVYSKLNFYTPDMNVMTDLKRAWVITLKPGDVLFVPPQWWHYVENIGTAISINTWLPLSTDCEKRLEESLVKLLVSQLTKEISDPENLLNPNEDDLRKCTIGESLAILETTMQQYYKQFLEKEHQCNENQESKSKRMRIVSNRSLADSEDVNTFLLQFKTFIQAVPILPEEKLLELLAAKRSHIKPSECNVLAKSPESCTIEKVINAVCHPDIISSIKARLMQEYLL